MSSDFSPMQVGNVGFMIDHIGQECAPLQYLRELTQNSIQAIGQTPEGVGEIVWDYYRPEFEHSGVKKLCIIDTGIGMSGPDMVKYINSAFRSAYEQGHDKNFGIGAKVAAATRNPSGLRYLSWKNGKGAMVHLVKDYKTRQYGLLRYSLSEDNYRNWVPIEDDLKPNQIGDHGTVVVLEGESDDDDTFTLPKEKVASEVSWVSHYLNTRYFEIPPGITIKASEHRVYHGDGDDEGRYSMRQITGQRYILDDISESNGSTELDDATAHWWIFKELGGGTHKGLTGGHVAALYQNELYEVLPMNRGGYNRLMMFGVVLGYSRVALYLQPTSGPGKEVISNTARTRLIVNSEELPWARWAAQFREKMPKEIRNLMDEVASRSVQKVDRDEIKRRIEELQELYNPSRYRLRPRGKVRVGGASIVDDTPPNLEQGQIWDRPSSGSREGESVYSAFIKEDGEEAEKIGGKSYPEIKWVSVEDEARDPEFIEDRAANYAKEANFLSINADFRVFDDLITLIEIRNPDVPGGRGTIEKRIRRHVEMALIETIFTFQGMSGSRHWPEEVLDKGLSEEALTAAVMPRQHVVREVENELKKGLR